MDVINMKDYTCCITGHRTIPKEKVDYVKGEIQKEVLQAVEDGYTHFISGFAQGVDLLFAAIVAELKKGIVPSLWRQRFPIKDAWIAKIKYFKICLLFATM